MEHGLPPVRSSICGDTIAGFRQTFQFRHLRTGQHKQAEQQLILSVTVLHGSHMLLRYHKRMHWSLRVDIVKCQSPIVFVNDRGRNLFFDDLAEETVAHFFGSLLFGAQARLAEPLPQFLIYVLEADIVIAEHHQRVEEQIGHFVDDFLLLPPLPLLFLILNFT